MRTFLPAGLLLLLALPVRGADPADDFFASKVRPILASHCFKCHGPDDQARKARLRLDQRAEALKPARSRKRAIVPGKPGESELVVRIHASDDSEVMPPPSTRNPLSAAQKKILERWISEGAAFTPHWAFVAPGRPVPPPVKDETWPRNPLDRFVLARLEKAGLSPAPQADRWTLARRLYLDLIGLPPTPEEVEAHVRDDRPDAHERLVDRLLASPAYGERWARRWLDLARYADTNGYEKDRPRSIWPWRDWVIGALNADLPFDRFTIEQLAGDLLPGAKREQRIATGLHRNTMLNEEGGIDPLEFRFHAMTDRLGTTGTIWLGLTVGCAQCHTHKYDPLSHKEYYRLLAFLNNADEPELDLPDPGIQKRRLEIEAEIARREAALGDHFPLPADPTKADRRPAEVRRKEAKERQFARWVRQQTEQTARWTVLRPTTAKASLPLLTVLSDDSVLASGDQSKSDTYDLSFSTDLKDVAAIRLEVLPDERLPRHGPGRVYYEGPFGDFFLSEISLVADGTRVKLASGTHSFASGTHTAQKALDGDQQTGWSINGGQGRAHHAIFRLEKPLASVRTLQVRMLFERYYAAGLGRFRIAVTSDRAAQARDLPLDLEPLLLLPPEKRTAEQVSRLERQFLLTTPELAGARTRIDPLRQQLPQHPTTLVLAERPLSNPRATFVHHRGEFLQPGERVEPGVPAFLPGLPRGAPANRLTFARWLVARDNPLTARVTVNRHWASLFGQGIVPTQGDFGLQGALPSHPDLLDWLAVEYLESGWATKSLHRLIVTSATYRQSSRVRPALAARDPGNRLLARGPRVRLEAEMVRDLLLRSSGLLATKVGGPSVFPPQPAEVTTEGTYGRLVWKTSEGRDRYRRGLYTFMKRTAPYALFSTFDGPSGEVCLAGREVSNTPLQALTMLNDQTILEASQELGRQLASEAGSIETRARRLFQRILVRPASADEVELLVRFFRTQKIRFEKKELDAAAVAGTGAPTADVHERAAWTALARVLFNLDETITKG